MSTDASRHSPFATASTTPPEPPPFSPVWAHQETMHRFSPLPGITMWSVTGGKLMFNFVRIDPGATVPTHHHPHEQAGTVLEGMMRLTIGDETRELHYGDAYIIPPNVPHSATTDEHGCLVIDVFTPPREDYQPT